MRTKSQPKFKAGDKVKYVGNPERRAMSQRYVGKTGIVKSSRSNNYRRGYQYDLDELDGNTWKGTTPNEFNLEFLFTVP